MSISAAELPDRVNYTCATCGQMVTVRHADAWPQCCPYCRTAPVRLHLGGIVIPESGAKGRHVK